MLSEHEDIEVLEAIDGIDALERIEETRPQAVFLDIEMPGLNGFEVLQHLRTPPLVVFATAHYEYAIRAFEANAIDYLLKPVQAGRLQQALSRIRTALQHPSALYEAALRSVLLDLRHAAPSRLAVRKNKRIVLLPLRTVQWAVVEDRLVFVHTTNERFLVDRTIGELEEMLQTAGFFRVNRGDLVNLDHVRELAPWSSGTCRLTLTSGEELNVSRDRVARLKELVGL
jgi:DNA-binding LytR/AlgR family response regulator